MKVREYVEANYEPNKNGWDSFQFVIHDDKRTGFYRSIILTGLEHGFWLVTFDSNTEVGGKQRYDFGKLSDYDLERLRKLESFLKM